MDFVGKSVSKNFKGFGVFQGVVESYDSATGFYRILYEDGDSEEIDSDEVSRLISGSIDLGGFDDGMVEKKVGRKPKRRRRIGPLDPGKIDGNLNDNFVIDSRLGHNLENNADVNVNGNSNVCVDGNVNFDGGLDLNRGFEIDEVVENDGVVGGIDLNVSVECESDENVRNVGSLGGVGGEEGKKERWFDLNLGFDDEGGNGMGVSMDVEVALGETLRNGITGIGGANGVSGSINIERSVGLGEELRNANIREGDSDNVDIRANDGQLEGSGLEGVTPIPCKDGNSGLRKRRKVGKKLSSPSEIVLRRSARRAKVATSAEIIVTSGMVEDGVNDMSVSGITEESEEKPVAQEDMKMIVKPEVPPSKIDLPPSTHLNLEGIPVVDLFEVYSCLRSFSTLLYLSPFEMKDFVAALKSNTPNLLIDCIHVSILQTLRKHLEFLANENCESASTCLRNLNWDLLDENTWPVFMMEYLLIHGSRLKTGYSLNQLNLLSDGGYYKQPENVKIELLRCLCDDVVEVEAIRLEVGRRRIMTEANRFTDRLSSIDPLGGDVEEVDDGNSDECCLCKMDGNLICCDGCPAAYHSKCVGIVSSLLPEGNWYCPECAISRHSFSNKSRKLYRGAEPLGIDSYGRLFFSCFDYLLVSDSYDTDSSFSYYHKDDLNTLIQLLESSSITYGSIIRAIFQNWAISTVTGQLETDIKSDNCTSKDNDSIRRKNKSSIIGCPSHMDTEGSEPPDLFDLETVNHCTVTEQSLVTSKEPDEVLLPANEVLQNSHRPLPKRISAAKRKKKHSMSMQSCSSDLKVKEEDESQELSGYRYVNSYKFGQLAASVVEELLRKPSDKVSVDNPKTEEEIISIQSKFITKKSTKFCWATIQHLTKERQKEKCGWCYCCRFSVEDRDCLFNIRSHSSIPEALKADIDAILSERNQKGSLVDIICTVLCMEERLRGLLLGQWISSQYSELWRKRVLQAFDVSSLKHPLLMLESNLHPMALATDWSKHVDSVATMGSAYHFATKSRINSKNGIDGKKGKYGDSETKSSAAGSGLSLFWWRGGRTSRSLFNWKVIPRSIALKAARNAGAVKIPDVLYADGPKNTRRRKYAAWRAAVEASRSIEQLALQVRELYMFIRWDDIENTQPHFLLDKETLKSIRLFKKAIIRRKCVEETIVKYLLDFGKRRSIPEVVTKHGLKLEESDGERKKYWLNETYVPIYLIKIFEERRVVRKAGKTKSSVVHDGGRKTRVSEEKGFEYLFSRAAKTDYYQCVHCNKNVPTSEAVSCRHCHGFFHNRHVMKSSEGYTCYKCPAGKHVKSYVTRGKKKIGKLLHGKKLKLGRKGMLKKGKLKKDGKILHQYQRMSLRNAKKLDNHEKQNGKFSNAVNLRRSPRIVTPKCIGVKTDVLVGARKRKRDINTVAKKTSKTSYCKKRRTRIFHSFWLNGLQLSRQPKDGRVAKFKRKRLCVAFESSGGVSDQPKCSLCLEQKFTSTLVYIACDICEAWFHGEAFGLNRRNIKSLIGFKCHVCLEKNAPVCPFAGNVRANVAISVEATSDGSDGLALPEVAVQMGKNGLQENHMSKDPARLPDLTQQEFDGISSHDNAPLVDSGLTNE